MPETRAMPEPEHGPASIRIQRRIEWSDTDASGAYHNTAAFRLMEAAETALVEHLGFLEQVYGRHPRVHVEADFLRPLFFRNLVDVTIRVAEVGRSSVRYECGIARDGEACVRGRLVAVLLDAVRGSPQPWPEPTRLLLETAGEQPSELLIADQAARVAERHP
jgi:2-aminobenzoate-CoA ligase